MQMFDIPLRPLNTDEDVIRLQAALDSVRHARAIALLDQAIKMAGYPEGILDEQAECLVSNDRDEIRGMLSDMEARMGIYVDGVIRILGL